MKLLITFIQHQVIRSSLRERKRAVKNVIIQACWYVTKIGIGKRNRKIKKKIQKMCFNICLSIKTAVFYIFLSRSFSLHKKNGRTICLSELKVGQIAKTKTAKKSY